MKIKKLTATITSFRDLSPTAREITIELPEDLNFTAGAFVNTFFDVNGETIRRAYSISSDDSNQRAITLSIRKVPEGKAAGFFWKSDIIGSTLSIMGPLGINTADKLTKRRLFLFGFGIGVSVIMAMLRHALKQNTIDEIVVMTGSRNEIESIYLDELTALSQSKKNMTFRRVLSRPEYTDASSFETGFIQDHISDFAFDDADVYICGHKAACDSLTETIQKTHPNEYVFHVEAFG
ncbi:MAG: ring,2-phenylacetyl-CoA epoxidase subunit PaaE [Patescibacteria group bacterium]|jgi:ferredoxin-NADP reductase|nr:ring,2-phenylacetyl-CoA epoxidase subunit PaaE [Patescibacteria group bacterium]